MARFVLALLVTTVFVVSACGDDEDQTVTGSDDASQATTGEAADTSSADTSSADTSSADTSQPDPAAANGTGEPAYEFAVTDDLGISFNPTAVATPDIGIPVETWVYPGQLVPLLTIELDPGGDPCPDDGAIEVEGSDGSLLTSTTGSEVRIPDDASGTLTITVRCQRDGESGIGVLELVQVAQLLELDVAPTTIATGGTVTVELTGGCPEGLDGTVGLTPEIGGGFGVIGPDTSLPENGRAEITFPDGATGTIYPTVQCFDGDRMAVAFAPVEVTSG